MVVVELLCIGNELLSGITINTNAHWLSQEITHIGGFVQRITVVRDDIQDISNVVKECLGRGPDWLIICGGLGPTYDDKTLEGLAQALGRKLVLDKLAVEMLKKSYARRSLNYELNEIRLKMATIPLHSTPIQNPVGSAPSVMINYENGSKNTRIVCLPGVPAEMKAIFTESVRDEIKSDIGSFFVQEVTYDAIGISEAMLAPTLLKIVKSYPEHSIYLKTHPRQYHENKPHIQIQIISKGNDDLQVRARLDNIATLIRTEVVRLGGKTIN